MKIGAQLYTVREYTQTLEGFAETLAKVADMGYDTVQVSGTCAYEPEWLKNQLDKNGLACAITHPDDAAFLDPAKTVREHAVYGCKHIGLGSFPGGARAIGEGLDKFIADYQPIARAFREAGARLMYHHHHYEFNHTDEGERFLDKIMRSFPAEDLGLTLDTYWIQVGGGNPSAWLRRLSGRVPCIHLKDLTMSLVDQHMAPVGSGNLDFEDILAAAEDAGTEYALVEQDFCYEEDPFECLKKSYAYLKSLGLR